eukprot:Gregarina_sp_Poly_1__9758@NODE_621_length_7097_cov_120_552347_g476_i0_p2_GENE_NODE_621_length_7097_cov_120_552347_g476_i0NODE_621_length_7097_cov_120_552347_g476_i0_p2_ORF_typecomplete_len440_score55_32DUF3327/PF11806_8/0_0018_NODE_621_length_7097_cov_120_552347_g476_i015372856
MRSVFVARRVWKLSVMSKGEFLLQTFLPKLVEILHKETSPECHPWWDNIIQCKLKSYMDFPDIRRSKCRHVVDWKACWNDYLRKLFREHFQLDVSPQTPPSKQDVLRICQQFDKIAHEEIWTCQMSQQVSLLLAVLAEHEEYHLEGLPDTDIWFYNYVMSSNYRRFPAFMCWVDSTSPAFEHFGCRVAWRFFVFEFLRKNPYSSAKLAREFEWKHDYPLQKIWSNYYDDIITNRATTSKVDPRRILFGRMAYLTPHQFRTNLSSTRWERMWFKNEASVENLEDLRDPMKLRTEERVGGKRINPSKRRRKLYYFTEWNRLWPQIFQLNFPHHWESREWILILAIASVHWDITGVQSETWKGAAHKHRLFWDWLETSEIAALSVICPILSRAAFRYVVLQNLGKVAEFEISEGVVWTRSILEHMWEATQSIRDDLTMSVDA